MEVQNATNLLLNLRSVNNVIIFTVNVRVYFWFSAKIEQIFYVVVLHQQKELPVHVSFSPSSMGLISSSLVIKSLTGRASSKVIQCNILAWEMKAIFLIRNIMFLVKLSNHEWYWFERESWCLLYLFFLLDSTLWLWRYKSVSVGWCKATQRGIYHQYRRGNA